MVFEEPDLAGFPERAETSPHIGRGHVVADDERADVLALAHDRRERPVDAPSHVMDGQDDVDALGDEFFIHARVVRLERRLAQAFG